MPPNTSPTIGTIAAPADFLEMLLPRRKEAALTYSQLAHRMYGDPLHPVTPDEKRRQRTHIRTLYELVRELRLRGVPVCGGEDGLWKAATASEAAAEAASLRRRYITQALTARALRRTARRMAESEAHIEQQSLGLVA